MILVGHSYGGMVITGAADRAPDRVGRLVFLDAATPRNGQSLVDVAGPVINAVRPFGEVVDGMELVLLPGARCRPALRGDRPGRSGVDGRAADRRIPGRASSSRSSSPTRTALWAIPQYHIVCTSTLATRDPELMAPRPVRGAAVGHRHGPRPDDHRAGEDGGRIAPGRRQPEPRGSLRPCMSCGALEHGVGRHLGEGRTDMHIPSRSIWAGWGWPVLTLAGTATVASVASGGGAPPAASNASGAPITIAMITSLTGEGSSEFSQAPAGFNARIALQNAEGGVNGHKIDRPWSSTTRPARRSRLRPSRTRSPRVPSASCRTARCSSWPTSTRKQAGRAGHRRVLRRARVGHAAVHEHVRLRRREPRPQVPGQHGHRDLLEGARRHRASAPTATASRPRRRGRPSARSTRSSTRAARWACSTPRSRSAPWR